MRRLPGWLDVIPLVHRYRLWKTGVEWGMINNKHYWRGSVSWKDSASLVEIIRYKIWWKRFKTHERNSR